MRTNLYAALASCVVAFTLIFAEPATTSADHDAHHQKNHKQATRHASHRAKAKRKARRRAVIYVCPMHPDIREKSAGTCPKCLMDLVVEPRSAKTSSKAKGNASHVGVGPSTSGSM
jgi:hypothetical protein